MRLSDKQALFNDLIGRLCLYVNGCYEWRVRDGDCYRDRRCDYGHSKSLHRKRLARDLILDRRDAAGRWRWQKKTEPYEWIGIAWERMHPLCRWGGRWGEGNHFSITHGGMK